MPCRHARRRVSHVVGSASRGPADGRRWREGMIASGLLPSRAGRWAGGERRESRGGTALVKGSGINPTTDSPFYLPPTSSSPALPLPPPLPQKMPPTTANQAPTPLPPRRRLIGTAWRRHHFLRGNRIRGASGFVRRAVVDFRTSPGPMKSGKRDLLARVQK